MSQDLNQRFSGSEDMDDQGVREEHSEEEQPVGLGRFLWQRLKQSFKVILYPKLWIPTIVLSVIWIILGFLGAYLKELPLVLMILSVLTFAQGGLYGGLLGGIGGIVGKIVVATFLNAMIMPLFQKQRPFSGVGGGLKGMFHSLFPKSLNAFGVLLISVGSALILYTFFNLTQRAENSMVAVFAFIMLVKSIGTKGGFVWGFLFNLFGIFTKGNAPTYEFVQRVVSGFAIGFALGGGLNAFGLKWCVWMGIAFVALGIGFKIWSSYKSNKEKIESESKETTVVTSA